MIIQKINNMIKQLKDFEKGDTCWVHSRDSREKSYMGFVKSAGKKYVTVCIDEEGSYPMRFHVDGGVCEDWPIYELYHNPYECNMALEMDGMRKEFRRLSNNELFTDEEIRVIMKMYKERIENEHKI